MGQLAAKVRAKYPGAYDDLTDEQLEAAVVAKYPGEYDDLVTPPTTPPKDYAQFGPMSQLLKDQDNRAQLQHEAPETLGTIGGGVGMMLGGVPGAMAGGAAGNLTGQVIRDEPTHASAAATEAGMEALEQGALGAGFKALKWGGKVASELPAAFRGVLDKMGANRGVVADAVRVAAPFVGRKMGLPMGGKVAGWLGEKAAKAIEAAPAIEAPAAKAAAPEVQLKRAVTPRRPRELKIQKQVMAQPDRYLGRVYRIGDQDVQLVSVGPEGVGLRAASKGTKLSKKDYSWAEWKALSGKAIEQ